MDIEQWEETYMPKPNHLVPNSSWQDENGVGIMYETYGDELSFIRTQDERFVWTYVDGDDGTYVISGYHIANRIGYFVTRYSWTEDIAILVQRDGEE